jgi:hypothetical protein
VLGGAIVAQEFIDAVEEYPDDSIGGIPKSTVLSIFNMLVPDIDTDGDGVDDAISVGAHLSASPTVIDGVVSWGSSDDG